VVGGIATAALAVLATAGGGVAAAATCVGASCNGLSAAATGCDQDARLIAGDYLRQESQSWAYEPDPAAPTYGTVHIWESPTCGTVWAVATRWDGVRGTLAAGITARTAPDGNTETKTSTDGPTVTSTMWTPVREPLDTYYAGAYGYIVQDSRTAYLGYASVDR
jgi:hypothetical protein